MKRFWIALALLFSCASVGAQCLVFLIPSEASVTIDEDGRVPWPLKRTEWVTGIPSHSYWTPSLVRIDDQFVAGPKSGAACITSEMRVNKKAGRVGVLITAPDNGKVIEFWLKAGHLDEFPHGWQGRAVKGPWVREDEAVVIALYDKPIGRFKDQTGSANRITIEHAASVALDEIKSINFKPPEIENQKTFPQDFDRVWSGLIEALSDAKWQIESIDKSSGLVTTKPAVGASADMVCATKFDSDHKTWLNIFAKKVEGGTRIKVNATFHAIREDEGISCYSNGTIEADLFKAIELALK